MQRIPPKEDSPNTQKQPKMSPLLGEGYCITQNKKSPLLREGYCITQNKNSPLLGEGYCIT